MILVIDNYDSFTFNLVQAIGTLDNEVVVRRNDALTAQQVLALKPAAVVLSPGPGRPEDAGCCMSLIEAIPESVPLLGVCLGHQALAAAFGGRVTHAPRVVHGKTAAVHHRGEGLFKGLPEPMQAARYHSLVAERASLPEQLQIDAWTEDDLVMAISHRHRPLFGVQFHPESIATPDGPALLGNFLSLAGVPWQLENRS